MSDKRDKPDMTSSFRRRFMHFMVHELHLSVTDQGVLVFFLIVPLLYPLIYTFIYNNETVREVPAVVVDQSGTTTSRQYLRLIDATPDVRLVHHAASLDEARTWVNRREAYGIILVPYDFSDRLHNGEQVNVRLFCDMSGLLYYKALLTANTNVSLTMNADIKVDRAGKTTNREEEITEHPIAYEEVSLYNPTNGFAAFLIPAVLILIIQQTLILGVGMSAGTARERNTLRSLVPIQYCRSGTLSILLGKAAAYALIYIPVSIYVLGVVPHLFRLNQIGNPADLALFVLPFLLASIFFAMTLSAVVRHRETCIMLFVFSSVLLLFISGVSWPGTAVPPMWKVVSWCIPSTFGINGFLKINNMGATLYEARHEWLNLWLLAGIYFATTCLVYRQTIRRSRYRF